MITRRRFLCIPVDFEFPDGELTQRLDVESLADTLARQLASTVDRGCMGPVVVRVDETRVEVKRCA